MNRTQRITVTAVAATGLLGGAGVALGLAPGMQAAPASTQLAADVTSGDSSSPELQALQSSITKLEDESAALQSDLVAAQKQLALAEKARQKAAQAAAAAQSAAQAKPVVRVQTQSAPKRHATTGASGAGGEHEGGHDD